MSTWNNLPAPINQVVWMFLPSSKYLSDEDGRPQVVENEVVLCEYDTTLSAWCRYNIQPRSRVYASMWADASNPSKPPAEPDLG